MNPFNCNQPAEQDILARENHQLDQSTSQPVDMINDLATGLNRINFENSETRTSFLTVPKLTKQFLISPPASPPVGWEPIHEGSPVIDVQLITAIANLVPGKMHEIHSGNESQPRIFVEVCEDPQFANEPEEHSKIYSTRIPKTMSPESFQRQSQQFQTIHPKS